MIVKRKEIGGEVNYDTKSHTFEFKISGEIKNTPYASRPLVLNIDLTFECNMKCIHCVAKDMKEILGESEQSDLKVTNELINKINQSPFMVMVITGGESLLPAYEKSLLRLIRGLKNKGIIVDTNGTIIPSFKVVEAFVKKDVLVRVSWDIPNPKVEAKLRKYPKKYYSNDVECMSAKQDVIKWLLKHNVKLAVQSVVHMYNFHDNNFINFPYKLNQYGIRNWYIQRFIPSYYMKKIKFDLKEYEESIYAVTKVAKKLGIKCHLKKDKRHNSVFLLVKDGDLYTQSDKKPGKKIHLGKIEEVDYFTYVSAPDHTARYIV